MKIEKFIINSLNNDKYVNYIKNAIIIHHIFERRIFFERFIENDFYGIKFKIEQK